MKKLLLIISVLISFNSLAKDGSSGCGPGWYVAKENSLLSSSLRITTNGILFPFVTLGMTFGTSNCTKHKIVKTEKESLYFVTQNYYELKIDSAKGAGNFVKAFGKTIGCKDKDLNHFSSQLQNNFENVFKTNNTNEEVLIQTYNVILTDPVLLNSCSLS